VSFLPIETSSYQAGKEMRSGDLVSSDPHYVTRLDRHGGRRSTYSMVQATCGTREDQFVLQLNLSTAGREKSRKGGQTRDGVLIRTRTRTMSSGKEGCEASNG
jgi:hypothetical protein